MKKLRQMLSLLLALILLAAPTPTWTLAMSVEPADVSLQPEEAAGETQPAPEEGTSAPEETSAPAPEEAQEETEPGSQPADEPEEETQQSSQSSQPPEESGDPEPPDPSEPPEPTEAPDPTEPSVPAEGTSAPDPTQPLFTPYAQEAGSTLPVVYAEEQLYDPVSTWMNLHVSSPEFGYQRRDNRLWAGQMDILDVYLGGVELDDWVGTGGGLDAIVLQPDHAGEPLVLEGHEGYFISEEYVGEAAAEGGEGEPISRTRRVSIQLYGLSVQALLGDGGGWGESSIPFEPGYYRISVICRSGQIIEGDQEIYLHRGTAGTAPWYMDWYFNRAPYDDSSYFLVNSYLTDGDHMQTDRNGPYDIWYLHEHHEGNWYNTEWTTQNIRLWEIWEPTALYAENGMPPLEEYPPHSDDRPRVFLVAAQSTPDQWVEGQTMLELEYEEYRALVDDAKAEIYGIDFLQLVYDEHIRGSVQSGLYQLLITGIGVNDPWSDPVKALTHPFGLKIAEAMEVLGEFQTVYNVGDKFNFDGMEVCFDYGEFGWEQTPYYASYCEGENIYTGVDVFSQPGNYLVTVETNDPYSHLTAEFTITIVDPVIDMQQAFPDEGFRSQIYAALELADGAEVRKSQLALIEELWIDPEFGDTIYSAQGLELLPNLKTLQMPGHGLESVDLSGNPLLEVLDISNNQITGTLDLFHNPRLQVINCSYNEIEAITFYSYGYNTYFCQIRELYCAGNQLTSLHIQNTNDQLRKLDCSENRLTSLGLVYAITALEELICSNNPITSLNLTRSPALTRLEVNSTAISTLNLSNNTELTYLSCTNNAVTTLNLSANQKLKYLYCSENQLTSLDTSGNPELLALWCENNQLTALDLSGNTLLAQLLCGYNQLEALDLSANRQLTTLYCNDNLLTGLDLTNNKGLSKLICQHNYMPSERAILGLEELSINGYNYQFTPQHVATPATPGVPFPVSRGTTHVSFIWAPSESSNIDHYVVMRDGVEIGTSPACEYTDTGLQEGTTYSYSLQAVDAAGVRSEPGTAAALSTAVLTLADHTAFESSYYQEQTDSLPVQLFVPRQEWMEADAVTAALYYRAQGQSDWSSLPLQYAGISAGRDRYAADWQVGSLPAGSYETYFEIREGGLSRSSAPKWVELKTDDIVPTVALYTPAPDAVFGRQSPIEIHALVGDNTGVQRVELACSVDSEQSYTTFATLIPEQVGTTYRVEEAFDQSGLASGVVYLRVTVYDRAGNHTGETRRFVLDMDAPATPSNFALEATGGYIHLNWGLDPVPADFSHFEIHRTGGEGGPAVFQNRSLGYYDDVKTGLQQGQSYSYYVVAVDKNGNSSAPTATLTGALLADESSPTIAAWLPKDGDSLRRETEIVVSAIDNYRLGELLIEFRPDGAGEWSTLATLPTKAPSNNEIYRHLWSLAEVPAGQVELRFTVGDTTGNTPDVRTVAVTVLPYDPPAAPQLSVDTAHKKALLSWSYSGDEELLYCTRIYRATAGGSAALIKTLGAGERAYTDAIANAVDYSYYIVAVDRYSETAQSNQVTVRAKSEDREDPVAVIAPEQLVAAVGQPFTFSGVHSTDNDAIAAYDWSFGDGETAAGALADHTYLEAGEFEVTLTVTDDSGNRGSATRTVVVHNPLTGGTGYTLVTFEVVDASVETTPPIKGATVTLAGNEGETVAVTGADGCTTLLLKNGSYTVSVMQGSYLPRSFTLEVDSAEGTMTRVVGLSKVSMVTGEITVTEMTYDEIVEANIDVNDPNNQHVSKIEVVFEFTVGEVIYQLPVTYYSNEANTYLGSASGTGFSGDYVGAGQLHSGEGAGGGYRIGVFPLSERFFLVVYGEAHWLKEMYNVELVVLNNSYTDSIEDVTATLELPTGMSLAAMIDRVQSADIALGTIGTAESGANRAVANWYVQGDAEGEYYLSAALSGTNMPNGDPFSQRFTTDQPVKVYAGSALELTILADNVAYRGEAYEVDFTLKNVSHKSLYNLSFSIGGAEQYQVTGFGEEHLWTQEDFTDGNTVGVGELAPGESVTLHYSTTAWFRSQHELGPTTVQYLLKNVFVTTLEGSTTEIPTVVRFRPVSRTAIYQKPQAGQEGELTVVARDHSEDVALERGQSADYVLSGATAATPVTVELENAFYGQGTGAVQVSVEPASAAQMAEGVLLVSEDAVLTVTGRRSSAATVRMATHEGDSYTLNLTVTGEAPAIVGVAITAPDSSELTIPPQGSTSLSLSGALVDAEESSLPLPEGAAWSLEGDSLTGLTIAGGLLTVDSTAQPGTLTVVLEAEGFADRLTLTLVREAPVATGITLTRGGQELDSEDFIPLPLEGEISAVYTAALTDQYGLPTDKSLLWSHTNELSGVSVQDGSVTVTAAAQPGSFTLTVTEPESGLSATLTVYVVAPEVDWSAVDTAMAAATYTFGDANGAAAIPQRGSATALETHSGSFAVASADEVQPAGAAVITVVFTVDADDPLYGGAAFTKDYAVAIQQAVLEAADLSTAELRLSKVYDGSTAAPALEGDITATGVMGEALMVFATAGDYPQANAGTHAVTLTLLAVGDPNYRLAEGLTALTLAGAEILPAPFTYTVEPRQTLQAGDTLADLAAPAHGTGVAEQPVEGALSWYLDAERETPATNAALVSGASVILTWSFVATDANYSAEPLVGQVLVTMEGEPPQPVVLTGIEITALPGKTAYTTGERLNLAGLTVTARYSDGSAAAVTGYTTSPNNNALLSSSGTKTVTVTYTQEGVTATASFTVTVKAPTPREVVTQVVTAVVKVVNTIVSWLRRWF